MIDRLRVLLEKSVRLSFRIVNKIAYDFFCLFPINERYICFESERDFSDNSYALYSYLDREGYFNRYKPIWFVNNPKEEKHKVDKVFKNRNHLRLFGNYALATSKYIVYDHFNPLNGLTRRKGQKVIFLTHGFGFKTSKGVDYTKIKDSFDYMTLTGELPVKGYCYAFKMDSDKMMITGYPRLDVFFQPNDEVIDIINKKWNIKQFNKAILWMPTFRKSNNKELSEDYLSGETGLPLVYKDTDLDALNHFLVKENVAIFLKIHHLQSEFNCFSRVFSNIYFIKDPDLEKLDIQLYQFVMAFDALISDYSSITNDYLLLDRPLIYTLDDFDEYNRNRGLWPNNCLDYMPGYHVYDEDGFKMAIHEINIGKDVYRDQRSMIISEIHSYRDGMSSQRVTSLLGLTK